MKKKVIDKIQLKIQREQKMNGQIESVLTLLCLEAAIRTMKFDKTQPTYTAIDGKLLTGLMRDNELPPDEILQRRNRYFACNDEWCQTCKWNWAGFVNNLEKFGVVKRKERSRRNQSVVYPESFCELHPDQHYPADKHCPECERIEI